MPPLPQSLIVMPVLWVLELGDRNREEKEALLIQREMASDLLPHSETQKSVGPDGSWGSWQISYIHLATSHHFSAVLDNQGGAIDWKLADVMPIYTKGWKGWFWRFKCYSAGRDSNNFKIQWRMLSPVSDFLYWTNCLLSFQILLLFHLNKGILKLATLWGNRWKYFISRK